MIGWIVVAVLVAGLGSASARGMSLRLGRAGAGAGVAAPLARSGIWFAVAGAALGAIFSLSAVGTVAGAALALGLWLVAAGWDEVMDRWAGSFYACLRREIYTLFSTPIPYFVLFLFTIVSGYFFNRFLIATGEVTLRYVFLNVTSTGFFLFPLLTMGLFAQERSEGTIEVLLTAPVSEASVTLAKFLATMTFYLVMLVPSVVYAAVIVHLGEEIGKPDVGPLLTSYVGLILAGALYVSIGLFTSALSASQILAALLSWVLILFFLIAGQLPGFLGLRNTPAGDAIEYVHPLRGHLFDFFRGVIDPADVVYFVSFTALFLFLAVRAIESRKWR